MNFKNIIKILLFTIIIYFSLNSVVFANEIDINEDNADIVFELKNTEELFDQEFLISSIKGEIVSKYNDNIEIDVTNITNHLINYSFFQNDNTINGYVYLKYNEKIVLDNKDVFEYRNYIENKYKIKLELKDNCLIYKLNNINYKIEVISNVPSISYISHVQSKGWISKKINGEMSGTIGRALRLEGLKINLHSSISGDVLYKAHVASHGWQDYVKNGELSGTTGQAKSIEAIRIKLTGEISDKYDIYYRVHSQSYGWLGWTKNGEVAGTTGKSKRIEAVEIKLVLKDDSSVADSKPSYYADEPSLNFQCHSQSVGWGNTLTGNNICGTVGLSKRLEAIKINLVGQIYSGSINYNAHVASIGWQNNISNGNVAGTTGKSKAIEALSMNLYGEISDYYDIYYRLHIAKIGWLGWAKNGEVAGTTSLAIQAEAVEIKLVKKGEQLNDNSSKKSFYNSNPIIKYKSYVNNDGWQDYVNQNQISGTTGQSKKIGNLIINDINNDTFNGVIEKSFHVSHIGWLDYVEGNTDNLVVDNNHEIEAIKLRLTNDLSKLYDIYYRVHVADYGWLGWAKNGEIAGSEGFALGIQAVEIVITKKGNNAPGSTANHRLTSAWLHRNGETYYSINGNLVTGFKTIGGVKYFFNSSGALRGTNVKKVIDVSSHQGLIDWNAVKNSDVDMVILRMGWGTYSIDSTFEYNLREVKRLNIPYTVYLFSYAENSNEAYSEAQRTINNFNNYNLSPAFNVMYDIESWNTSRSSSENISPETYESIITTYVGTLNNAGIGAGVYANLNYTQYKLTHNSLQYVQWIAHYNNTCGYNGNYKIWQYTSKGSVPGINGNVDISVWYN